MAKDKAELMKALRERRKKDAIKKGLSRLIVDEYVPESLKQSIQQQLNERKEGERVR